MVRQMLLLDGQEIDQKGTRKIIDRSTNSKPYYLPHVLTQPSTQHPSRQKEQKVLILRNLFRKPSMKMLSTLRLYRSSLIKSKLASRQHQLTIKRGMDSQNTKAKSGFQKPSKLSSCRRFITNLQLAIQEQERPFDLYRNAITSQVQEELLSNTLLIATSIKGQSL